SGERPVHLVEPAHEHILNARNLLGLEAAFQRLFDQSRLGAPASSTHELKLVGERRRQIKGKALLVHETRTPPGNSRVASSSPSTARPSSAARSRSAAGASSASSDKSEPPVCSGLARSTSRVRNSPSSLARASECVLASSGWVARTAPDQSWGRERSRPLKQPAICAGAASRRERKLRSAKYLSFFARIGGTPETNTSASLEGSCRISPGVSKGRGDSCSAIATCDRKAERRRPETFFCAL